MDLNNFTPIYFHQLPPKTAYFAGRHCQLIPNKQASKYIDEGFGEDVSWLLPGEEYPKIKSAPKGKEQEFFQETVKAYEKSRLEITSIKNDVDTQRRKVASLMGKVNRWAQRNNIDDAVNGGKRDKPEIRIRREFASESTKLEEVEDKFVEKAQQVRINEMQMESARIDLIKKQAKDLKNSKEFKALDDAIGSMLEVNEKAKEVFKDVSSIYGRLNVMEAPYVNGPLPGLIQSRRDQMFDVLDKYSDKAISKAEGKIKQIVCEMINEEIEYRDLFVVEEVES